MTSPVSDITSDISAVQSRIAQIVALTGTSTSSTSSTSGSSFANELSDASATSDATTASFTSADATSGDSVVADAKKYIGVPYVWGGESTSGMDCSGLVQTTYKDLGVTLPRTAAAQQQVGTPVASLADAQPGDLLFFGKPAYHVAIYAGDNKLIESPEPGKTVHETTIYQTPTSISRIVGSSLDPISSDSATADSSTGLSSSQLQAAGMNSAVAAYATQFAAAEQRYHLPTGMLAAVAQQESGGNASAVSSVGAEGLMQLMPSTAASHGVNAYDPAQAIVAAAQILHGNLAEFHNSVPLALAAYNAGAGAVQEYGGIPPYSQTQNYVKDITAMMARGA